MPNSDSTTKFRADISQLKSAMQQAQREVKMANAQFKTFASGLDNWSKSADGLSAKVEQLTKVQGAQKKQLKLLEDELKLTVQEYGENSEAAEKLRLRIEGQKAAINKTEKDIRNYSKELEECGKETDDLGDESKQTEKEVKNLSDGFTTAKGVLADLIASGIKAAIQGFKNLASAAKEAYDEFDKGADAVIKATGATGEAAKELEESYNNVAHNVVGDMGDIGSALGEVNTRFGFTGKELEDATENFLKFADITGTDATEAVRLVSRAIENGGMDAKEYTKILDVLAKAGQTTGVNVSSLTEQVTKNGAALRQLGFSTEESVAMLAKFEKEGVNTDTVLAGLKKAVANWGKEGKNAKEEFAKVLDEIAKTEDVAAASEIAIEAFGSKAGPELVEDIQAGKLEYQDFLDVLKDSTGTVTDTYEATQDGFDKITLAIQGGKADLGKFVLDLATEYQDDIVNFINKVKDGIKKVITWVVKNGDVIIETIKSIGKVLAVVFAVKTFSKWANGINTAITAVKGFAAAMKGAQAASAMASSSTGLFASLVSPGGAVVLGIAAVVAVTATLISLYKEEKTQIDVLTEAQKESIQKSHEMKDAYDAMDNARKTAMGSVQNEFGYYQTLLQEFDSIVSGNGKIKEGYEDRATFIMTTLNQALGMEMTMQDGIIQNYAKERQEINKLLELKKAEAILQANEAAYTEAIQKRTEATNAYTAAKQTFNDVFAKAEEYAVKVQEAEMEIARLEREEGIEAAHQYAYEQQAVFDTYAELQMQVTETKSALQLATEAYEGYNQTIVNYEGLSSAIISGDSEKINDALIRTENGLKDHTNTTADQLKKQADITKESYERLKKAYEEGDKTISAQAVNDAKKLAETAAKEYELSGKNTVVGYAKGLKDNSVYAETAAKNLGYDSYADFNESLGIQSPSTKTYKSGEFFAQGFINGMGSKESAIYQKAVSLAKMAVQGLKDGQKEGSPSKITTQSGKYFTEGFMRGISSMTRPLVDVVKDLVKEAISELDSRQIIQNAKASAKELFGSAGSALSFGDISGAKAGVVNTGTAAAAAMAAGTTGSGSRITNNTYNLVQNNTSPKALTALETYQARKRQIALMKAMT